MNEILKALKDQKTTRRNDSRLNPFLRKSLTLSKILYSKLPMHPIVSHTPLLSWREKLLTK